MKNDQTNISQYEKALRFKNMHTNDVPFIMPNPWDQGTAILMQNAGFKALGTTSAGLAFSLGKLDREQSVTLDETIANAKSIIEVTHLPLSIDLEDGFGSNTDAVKQTIKKASLTGAVGGSIEDYTGNKIQPIRDFDSSVERVEAAVQAAKLLSYPFTITARAENFLYGNHDLNDTILRLKAYRDVGADVLYAPALPDAESIKAVCLAVDAPVNVLLGAGNRLSVNELFSLGVTRVSLGSALSRAALGGFVAGLHELQQHGTCNFLDHAIGYFDVRHFLEGRNLQ